MSKSNSSKGRPFLGRTVKFTVTLTPGEAKGLRMMAAKKELKVPLYLRTVIGLGR